MDAIFLLIIPPCVALMAPIMGPTVSVVLVSALAVALGISMIILIHQTWYLGDDDEDRNEDDPEATLEDATNIVRAALEALARDPGAASASFRVVDGRVVHQRPAADAPRGGDGFAEEVGANGDEDDTGRGERESWSEGSHAWGEGFTISSYDSGREYKGFKRIGGFRILARRREGEERVERMGQGGQDGGE